MKLFRRIRATANPFQQDSVRGAAILPSRGGAIGLFRTPAVPAAVSIVLMTVATLWFFTPVRSYVFWNASGIGQRTGALPDLALRDGRNMEPTAETVDKLSQVPEHIRQAIPGYDYLRDADPIWESFLQQGKTERRQQQIVNQNGKGEPTVMAAAPAVNSLDLFKMLIDSLNAVLGVAGLVLGLGSVARTFKERRAASAGTMVKHAGNFHAP
jgi:hypothetical protein